MLEYGCLCFVLKDFCLGCPKRHLIATGLPSSIRSAANFAFINAGCPRVALGLPLIAFDNFGLPSLKNLGCPADLSDSEILGKRTGCSPNDQDPSLDFTKT